MTAPPDDGARHWAADVAASDPAADPRRPPTAADGETLREGSMAEICVLDTPSEDAVQEAAVAAVHAGDLRTLQRLLDTHPDLASARLAHRGGRTLLHVATDWPGHRPGVAATISALVAAGADPDVRLAGEDSETPLHWAASADDVAAVDALLDAGADLEARGAVIGGGTAMADATAFGQWNAARRLLDRHATTTLFDAAALGLVPEVVRLLGVTAPDAGTVTSAFWGACHGGHVATAALLLDAGADPDWVGYDDHTPLDAARRSGAATAVGWLERRGARSAVTQES